MAVTAEIKNFCRTIQTDYFTPIRFKKIEIISKPSVSTIYLPLRDMFLSVYLN